MHTVCSALLFVAQAIISSGTVRPAGRQGFVGAGVVGAAQQGTSVAISADGNTAVVGGPSDNCTAQGCAGAAWVYTRNGAAWSLGNKLVGTSAVGGAFQGTSVAISGDGNTVIVGGPGDNSNTGAVWIFTRSGGVWSQQGNKLVGTGAIGNASQGSSVAISADGGTAIVGGPDDNSADLAVGGAAWVYQRVGSGWSQQGNKLVGSDAGGPGFAGYSVAISADGNTAIVGGPWDFATRGAAWAYGRTNGVWSQQGNKLVDTSPSAGTFQGWSVAISADGNTAVVGDAGDDYQSSIGAARVYTRSAGGWSQQGDKLVGSGAVGGASQGWSVALSPDGNTAIVGGVADNSLAGAAWVFARSGGQWSQAGSKLVGAGADGPAWQGYSLAMSADGKTVLLGGPGNYSGAGAAWVFVGGGATGTNATGITRSCAAPSISEHPQSQESESGEAVTLSVTATGAAPISYQWYEGTSGDTSNPVGTDGATFTTVPRTEAARFWVRLRNSCGPADSATATVTARKAAVRSMAQPTLAPPPQQFVLDFGVQTPFGPSASVTEPVSPALSPGNQFTIEFWLYLEGATPNRRLCSAAGSLRTLIFFTSSTPTRRGLPSVYTRTVARGARGGTAVAPIPLRTWTHIAGTLDGQTLSLLVNGTVVSAVASPGPPAKPDSSFFQLGPGPLAAFRQVRIWSRALTPAEITANASRSGRCKLVRPCRRLADG